MGRWQMKLTWCHKISCFFLTASLIIKSSSKENSEVWASSRNYTTHEQIGLNFNHICTDRVKLVTVVTWWPNYNLVKLHLIKLFDQISISQFISPLVYGDNTPSVHLQIRLFLEFWAWTEPGCFHYVELLQV